jgi:hypothetical protein
MDFGEVLGKSWKIVWKHKVLWIFGILAGCARGGGGGRAGGGLGGGGGQSGTGNPSFIPGISRQNPQLLSNIQEWITTHEALVVVAAVAFVLLVLVLALIPLALGTIGEIGLIKGASKADGGAEHLGFGEIWQESLPYFWRVLGLSLLAVLAFVIVVVLIIGCTFLAGVATLGIGALIVLPLICILIPVALIAGLVVQLADIAMVTEDLGLKAGVRRGWELFKKELGPVLIIWLITAVIEIVVGIVITIPILVVVVPALLTLVFNNGNVSSTALLIAGACFVAYLPVLLVANGILIAYAQSVWTLTYLRLTRPKPVDPTAPALPANA